ncbi:MAG: hypothetical protein LBM02_07670, partial [Lachnospiraceae bacterium]|nr:hypothetical protein [Lachnospiraceae bacterium]
MGVKFSKDESEKIIHAMENNLKLANEIITRLSSGCSHLQNSLNSGELSGAAYKAGSSLFAKIIIPTIKKLKAAVNDIKAELKSYKYAHTVAVEACIGGYADLEMFQQQVRIKKAKIQVIDEQLRTNQNFI